MHTQARGPRSGAPEASDATAYAHRDPTPGEGSVLRLLSEQVAIPLDQLARFLGRTRVEAEELVGGLQATGCVAQRRFLADDAAWVWPTRRGARLSGTGFAFQPPTVRWLTHRRAVNEVRLHLGDREPEGRWVCERELERRLEPGTPKPDAVFEVGGERHAIEVELSRKSAPVLRTVIGSHSRRYDAVIYFCSPQSRGLLDRTLTCKRWPKLLVREVPGLGEILATRSRGFGVPLREGRRPTHVRWARRRKLPRQPADWGRDLLALICEQGAVPLDQLARFLGSDPERAALVAARLCDAKYARRAPLLADEPDWIWLTESGTRLSRAGFKSYLPAPGALARLRAINEARLRVEGGAPHAHWVGWRTLRRELRGAGLIPDAVVEIGGERHAIEVELTRRKRKGDAVRMVQHRSANYDAVVCFCVAKTRRYYERLAAENHWPKLLVRELPNSAAEQPTLLPTRWSHCAEAFDAKRVAQRPSPRSLPASRGSRKLAWQPAENPQRSEVDDHLWEELEPLALAGLDFGSDSKFRRMPDRTALSGIVYIARHQLPWNDLPHELGYGSGVTCLERLRSWERAGVWATMCRLLETRLEDGKRIDWGRLAPQQPSDGRRWCQREAST